MNDRERLTDSYKDFDFIRITYPQIEIISQRNYKIGIYIPKISKYIFSMTACLFASLVIPHIDLIKKMWLLSSIS